MDIDRLQMGILAMMVSLAAIFGVWVGLDRQPGWHVEEEVEPGEDFTCYPGAEQMEYVAIYDRDGPIRYENVTVDKWLAVQCELVIQEDLAEYINDTFGAEYYASFTSAGADNTMDVHASTEAGAAALQDELPEKIACTVHFEGHSYTDTIDLNVGEFTVETPSATLIECDLADLRLQDATYSPENRTLTATVANTGSPTLEGIAINATGRDEREGETVERLPANSSRTVTITMAERPGQVRAASVQCPTITDKITDIRLDQ